MMKLSEAIRKGGELLPANDYGIFDYPNEEGDVMPIAANWEGAVRVAYQGAVLSRWDESQFTSRQMIEKHPELRLPTRLSGEMPLIEFLYEQEGVMTREQIVDWLEVQGL